MLKKLFEKHYNFICHDTECGKYGTVEFTTRKFFFYHVQKKTDDQIISVFKRYGMLQELNLKYLHRLTLLNLFTDMCKDSDANRLLVKGVVV